MLGIEDGMIASHVLRSCHAIEKLICVDPYRNRYRRTKRPSATMELERFGDRGDLLFGDRWDVIYKRLQDNQTRVDFIFVDVAPFGMGAEWTSLLNCPGIFAGYDGSKRDMRGRKRPDITPIAESFAAKHNVALHATGESSNSWWMILDDARQSE